MDGLGFGLVESPGKVAAVVDQGWGVKMAGFLVWSSLNHGHGRR
jgi:hypothetical protein